jgi:hypothetical protein
MTGADVPSLAGIAPGDLVAFKYDAGWQQIPVQVDERAAKDFGPIYNQASIGVTEVQYTDSGTFTGADPNPTLDPDDEIAFMARDAGDPAGAAAEPAGVIAGTGLQLTITDPIDAGTGYVYLFAQDGSLDAGAGQQYVSYTFNLLSGPYLSTYDLDDTHPELDGNPENSTITTASYTYHFGDRWQADALTISTAGASNVDILDRHKPLFGPGFCVRSEDTFDGYVDTQPIEGAFVINKSGPVRAIRSYVGANSGPLTQREHVFYDQRQDIRTFLRVHAIPSVMDFMDYSPAANGMTYYNDLNLAGVAIDGNPESPALGAITWELVDGPQGALFMSHAATTNIQGFTYTSYYLDDSTPSTAQCTGDATAYGSSGLYVNQSIPNTDPWQGGTSILHTTRTMYFLPPGQDATDAAALDTRARAPLAVSSAPWPASGDSDSDGINDAADNCATIANPSQQNTDAAPLDNGLAPGDEATILRGDALGDACDGDDDNDGLSDTLEGVFPIPGCSVASAATVPLDMDSDGDHLRDGWECAMGSDPASAASKALGTGTTDADADRINDLWESRGYNASGTSTDSDGDACHDLVEIASIDGNLAVGDPDRLSVARRALNIWPPQAAQDYVLDINKNGTVDDADRVFVARAALLPDWLPKSCA